MKSKGALFCFILIVCFCVTASAQVPRLINYQGRLVNGTNLVNGIVGMTLRVYPHPTLKLPRIVL
mgnify:CR=1 FL=1